MPRRIPVLRHRCEVVSRRIALVSIVAVAGVRRMVHDHFAIPYDLRDDGCRSDRRAAAIAVQHPALRHQQIWNPERIDEDEVGQRCQHHDCAAHRLERGAVDVDLVDFGGRCRRDGPGNRFPGDHAEEPLAFGGGDHLPGAHPGDIAFRVEHHRPRDDPAGQTAAANLVDTGDAMEPETPQGVLQGPHRAHFDHGSYCALLVSFILAAFPFSSRRKYSFARRTRADLTTSTLAIVGECSGKMRSTPCPNDTFRTVNDARAPPRCRPMMIPSQIWMCSLSPSRTLTCTRPGSPDFIRGRSANCDFSTSSIALISRLLIIPAGLRPPLPYRFTHASRTFLGPRSLR